MSMEMLSSMVGKTVRINRKGPDSVTGKILNVFSDYLVLWSEGDGLVYVRSQHIKSFTESTKQETLENSESSQAMEYVTGETFELLVQNFQYQWVRINRGGPEKLEGVVENMNGDIITLISNDEIIHLPVYHIRGLSYGEENSQKEEKEAGQEGKSEKKESKK
ncbi:DUF2642 domain-containing protein [Cytobacillus oceanisediminis]|nr:DUF2642 domain-containing protein [Cytobacillus oceanisediminis]